jgi:hypothetical protein
VLLAVAFLKPRGYAIKVKLPEKRHLAADALRAGRSGAGEERMGRARRGY